MKSGRMTERIEVLRPVTQTNAFGEDTVVWDSLRTVHAELVSRTGARSDEVGEHFPTYDVAFNIRNAHVVRENWRVRHVSEDGYLYTVTAVVPHRRFGYKELRCVRVNE